MKTKTAKQILIESELFNAIERLKLSPRQALEIIQEEYASQITPSPINWEEVEKKLLDLFGFIDENKNDGTPFGIDAKGQLGVFKFMDWFKQHYPTGSMTEKEEVKSSTTDVIGKDTSIWHYRFLPDKLTTPKESLTPDGWSDEYIDSVYKDVIWIQTTKEGFRGFIKRHFAPSQKEEVSSKLTKEQINCKNSCHYGVGWSGNCPECGLQLTNK